MNGVPNRWPRWHETGLELTAELNLNALLESIAQHALNLIGGKSQQLFYLQAGIDSDRAGRDRR